VSNGNKIYESAKTLSRNPLGIIALFIVLVYAVASIVISLAKAEFYTNPCHPSVLFLALFPVVVLGVFTYLVAKHHEKLYSPQDYSNQSDFLSTIRSPAKIERGVGIAATSDEKDHAVNEDMKQRIDESYREVVKFGFCLLHAAEVTRQRTIPGSGRYKVRVWVEAIQHRSLSDIESVTYRVWDDFPEPVLTTKDRESNFDLWMTVYGEFPVIALVKTTTGETHELQRYVDVPGRPQE
jgi:hypothetical protein